MKNFNVFELLNVGPNKIQGVRKKLKAKMWEGIYLILEIVPISVLS